MRQVMTQVGLACLYYFGLVGLLRLAGKRLAGQTTSFDLVVLISLSVVLQQLALMKGMQNALIFVITVFVLHRLVALACSRSASLRRIVRGKPRPLIQGGVVSNDALIEEGLSHDDLLAGLRKCGYENPAQVRLATLEETGEVSVLPY